MAITEPRAPALAPEPQRHWLLQWLTTTDHKRIGILYLLNSFAFFFVAGLFALLMRTELAAPGRQLVTTNGYNQLFTLHGTLMIFLFIFPVLIGCWPKGARPRPAGPATLPSPSRAGPVRTSGSSGWWWSGPRPSSAASTSSSRSCAYARPA
jgi:Cytochrome C and Quinol oxidase polypeptide I